MDYATEGHSLPSPSCGDGRKRNVCYYYDSGIANVDYGAEHVMVPRRVAMTHALVASYGLLPHMTRLRTTPATEHDLRAFHDDGYVRLLRDISPDGYYRRHDNNIRARARACRVGVPDEDEEADGGHYDNPVIDGLWDYCLRYAGGSLAAARALAAGRSDIAINWSGGMHHACSGKASGFCYVNDIVLAIQHLLDTFARVLYVDIDVHHGDGVEEHFKGDERVMTVSFHRYDGDQYFFPGTGKAGDVGEGKGKYRTLNVPMKAGMDDASYLHSLFVPIMDTVMSRFQPDAVVLQCGADSLYGDRLGGFNLSVSGHAACVSYLRSCNVPLLLLGGGGYTVNHVASCWCYETAVAVGKEEEIPDDIPHHGYEHYYRDQGYKLHYPVPKKSSIKKEDIDKIKQDALANLRMLNEPPPTSTILHHRPSRSHAIEDDKALYDDEYNPKSKRHREADDPMERLHRLCGKADAINFFTDLGMRGMKQKNSNAAGSWYNKITRGRIF
jgi:histone deacetylase 1/2